MSATTQVRVPLGFTRAEDVVPDHERPGMLRAQRTDTELYDWTECVLHDCSAPDVEVPMLETAGFEAVDISTNQALQDALATVRSEDRISDAAGDAIRAAVAAATIPLADGGHLRVDFVSDDGLINRRAGPNGLDVNPDGMDGANGHDGATGIHGDQDVYGTPLRQTMAGKAPEIFRHQTPDGRNDESATFLLNMWIPIQQVTRPLVLMDRRTLDQQRHQLRYGLPVDGFLDRDDEMNVNDIWTFLPDPDQRWYFHSRMDATQCYVFDTLGMAHGSAVLPGEDALERLYLQLGTALEATDTAALVESASAPAPELAADATEPVRRAWRVMVDLLDELRADPAAIAEDPTDWRRRAAAARDAVIRKSVELRLVATKVGPDA